MRNMSETFLKIGLKEITKVIFSWKSSANSLFVSFSYVLTILEDYGYDEDEEEEHDTSKNAGVLSFCSSFLNRVIDPRRKEKREKENGQRISQDPNLPNRSVVSERSF